MAIAIPYDRAGARTTIEIEHSQVHAGVFYSAQADETLASGSALSLFVTAAYVRESHIEFYIDVNGAGSWTFSEAPGVTGGVLLTSFNHYRAKQDVLPSEQIVTQDATFTSTGSIILSGFAGLSGKKLRIGGAVASRDEWIFEDAATCLLRFVAGAASCRTILTTRWYELQEP